MSDERRLHFGDKAWPISQNAGWRQVADKIEEAVLAGGGWVDIPTRAGVYTVFASAAVPMWFEPEFDAEPASQDEGTVVDLVVPRTDD